MNDTKEQMKKDDIRDHKRKLYAINKKKALDAKIRLVHDAAVQLLIDWKLPTSALSHQSLVKLYGAICSVVDIPVSKATNWLVSPQQVECHPLYKQHADNTSSQQPVEPIIEIVKHAEPIPNEGIQRIPRKHIISDKPFSLVLLNASEQPAEPTVQLVDQTSISEQIAVDSTQQIAQKRSSADETLSLEKPAKRPCTDETEIVDLNEIPDGSHERDDVEEFLSTSTDDFIPNRKMDEILHFFFNCLSHPNFK